MVLVRVSRKGSPSVPGISLMNLMCGSMQLKCSYVFYIGTSTIKSLPMHPKDPIPDSQKSDIIRHWKCPAHNCTAEYIGKTNRPLKERVSDHRIKTFSAIRNYHISTNH